MIRRLAILVVVAAVAACGDIPQPFRHEGQPDSLARPKLTRGVTVRQPANTEDARLLADALVRALELQEVPALVQDGPAFGHVIDGEARDLGKALGVRWVLKGPDGQESASHIQSVPKTALAKADPKHLTRLAADAAAVLAGPLADPDAQPNAENQVAVANRMAVTVIPLRGLPGDGDTALTGAIARALDRGGLVVKDDGADYMVEGKVVVAPGVGSEDSVTVAWILKRAADSIQLANIGQSGTVPRGRLSGPWGLMARDIAEGGAAGLIEVIQADSGMPGRK